VPPRGFFALGFTPMRWLVAALICVGSAFRTYLLLAFVWLFTVGTECDRAECSAPGEWADENPGLSSLIVIVLCLGVGLLAGRAFIRRGTSGSS
jgi:hypothetical protein